jgi:hypothetical protein
MRDFKKVMFALSALLLAGVAAPVSPAQAAAKCSKIFIPVCAVTKAGDRQTFSNSCMARAAHATILHSGKCGGEFCEFIFLPVCARDPATRQPTTYPNACLAEKANAPLLHNGACQ